VARRRLTVKRIDPWSVLKFGFIANLTLVAIGLLGAVVAWFFVRRLQLVEKACEIATDVGFQQCSVNGGNLFRAVLLLGLLWVVVQTGLLVFLAFLHNLIADLTGGLQIGVIDDQPEDRSKRHKREQDDSEPSTPPPPIGSGTHAGGGAPTSDRWSEPSVTRTSSWSPSDEDERMFGERDR
jgi:hypothetical protein